MNKAMACIAVLSGSLAASMGVRAAGFECGWRPAADEPSQIRDIETLLPVGDAFDQPAKLNAAVDALRQQGLSEVLIVDNLIDAYCPVVAANSALSDAQKTARMRRFAGRVVRFAYRFESADAIILDVPFPPQAVDAINAQAQAAGTTAEAWVAQIVEAQLKR
jgi:hypothetical protein